MPLDPKQHQGLFGETFVRVLAAAAGLTLAKTEPDVTGEDFTLGYKGKLRGTRHPKIEVQVKSWRRSVATWDRRGLWKYRMERRHFNELAGTDFALPRFLFLVIVPDHWQDYAISSTDSLTLHYCAYWLSLADREPVDENSSGRVAVDVPVDNVLSVGKLVELMGSGARNEVA